MGNLSIKVNALLNTIMNKHLVAIGPGGPGVCCDCCEDLTPATTTLEFIDSSPQPSGTARYLYRLCDEHFSEVLHEMPSLTKAVLKLKGLEEPVDMVNHPPHYKSDSGLEVIDVIEAFKLNYHLGAATKYILRHDKKGDALTDLKKAVWYLEREIARRQANDDISS